LFISKQYKFYNNKNISLKAIYKAVTCYTVTITR